MRNETARNILKREGEREGRERESEGGRERDKDTARERGRHRE